MRSLYCLTKLYVLGSVRRQVHLATLFLGVILLMLPAYVNAFSLGVNAFERVSKDFALTLVNYFGVGMAILIASSSIPRDLENRSLYPILARPISRYTYVTAHFLSVLTVLTASFLFLGGCISLSVSALTKTPELTVFIAVFGIYLQSAVVAAVVLSISTVASPALAGTVGAFVFLVGSLPQAFIQFFLTEDRQSSFSANLASGIKSLLPNLTIFSLKDAVVHDLPLSPNYLVACAVYAVVWIAVCLTGATILFGRRDL